MTTESRRSSDCLDEKDLSLHLGIREAWADYRRHITVLAEILRQDIRALTEPVHEAIAKLDSLQR